MPLNIGTTAFSQWHSLKPLLEQLGWIAPSEPADTEIARIIPEGDASGPMLLLHTRPERAVAVALDSGMSPDQALAQWQESATRLLQAYKSHRKYAVMVDAACLAGRPRALVDWLKQHHPAFFDIASGLDEVSALAEPSAPSELNLLMATQLVAQSDDIQRVLPQLEACSVPLEDQHYAPPVVDVLAVHDHLNDQVNNGQSLVTRLQNQLEEQEKRLSQLQQERVSTESALKQENELLITQLHKVQEELESYYHKHKNGTQVAEELTSTRQALEADVQRLKEQLAQSEQAQTALESEKQRLNEALEQTRKAVKGDCKALEAENARLKESLAQAQDTTAQHEAAQKDLKEENDLILKQLFLVQEELEKYYLETKSQSSQLKEKEATLSQRDKELAALKKANQQKINKLQKQLDKAQRENNWLETKVVRRQVNIDQLKKDNRLLRTSLTQLSSQQSGFKLSSLAAPIKRLQRSQRETRRMAEVIRASDLFDATWYLSQNADVKAQSLDPALHYILHGAAEGRAPGPEFDAQAYLEKHPDVAEQGLNPLVHYLLHGKAEGRSW